MDVIIDFNGYYLFKKFLIKEFSLFWITISLGEVDFNRFGVMKPLLKWKKLDKSFQNDYQVFYNQFGIKWENGTKPYHDMIKMINADLSTAQKIYVRDPIQRRILEDHIIDGSVDERKILDLRTLGFKGEMEMSTTCANHDGTAYNCANDNLMTMTAWLLDSNLYKIEYRSKMHIIFSFNEYQMNDGTSKLKDIYLIALDESFLVDYAFHASIIGSNELDSRSQTSQEDFYNYGGILWENEEETYQNLKQSIRNYLEDSTFIYVENLPQKKILIDLVGLKCVDKIICLDEFGFQRPQCSPNLSFISLFKRDKRRRSKQESYIAHDIPIRMKDWLEKSSLYIAMNRDSYIRRSFETSTPVHRIRSRRQ